MGRKGLAGKGCGWIHPAQSGWFSRERLITLALSVAVETTAADEAGLIASGSSLAGGFRTVTRRVREMQKVILRN